MRYPQGFRHFENYANYSYVHKEATIEDYMKEMNRPCDFTEFLSIQTEHLRQQLETPEGRILMRKFLDKLFGEQEINSDEDPSDIDMMDHGRRRNN